MNGIYYGTDSTFNECDIVLKVQDSFLRNCGKQMVIIIFHSGVKEDQTVRDYG